MPKATIVWIEDDIDVIYPVVIPLVEDGYLIEKIYSIKEARARLGQILNADLVLLDMIAPDEVNEHYPGLEFMRDLRKENIKAPVIVLTVVSAKEVHDELIALGVKKILRKPVRPTVLKQTVEEVLGARTG
jgi:CheY-like chemotaxis protein